MAARERASLYEKPGCLVSVKPTSRLDELLGRHGLENPELYGSAVDQRAEQVPLRI